MRRRSSYLKYHAEHKLGARPPVELRCYDKDGKYVCRVVLNSARIKVYTGNGKKLLANNSWDSFVKRLKLKK